MRSLPSVAVIGAGQAGLLLTAGLLRKNYPVTLVTDRSPSEIAQGSIMSNQITWPRALHIEKNLGLRFGAGRCPSPSSMSFSMAESGKRQLAWRGSVNGRMESVDQRVKFPALLELVRRLGGNIVYEKSTLTTLSDLAKVNDLVVVSTGKGELGSIFPINNKHTIFKTPQRKLACFYVTPPQGYYNISLEVRGYSVPGQGVFFITPGLTLNDKICEMILVEAIPGSSLDRWSTAQAVNPATAWEICQQLIEKHLPWETNLCRRTTTLIDAKAVLTGSYAPTVRHAVATLPTRTPILGMGDAVVLNDPIGGQGGNNASQFAQIYLNQILKRPPYLPFDESWMQDTFAKAWDEVRWGTELTNMSLLPPTPQFLEFIAAANRLPAAANAFANAFDDPKGLLQHLTTLETTRAFIRSLESESPTPPNAPSAPTFK